MKEYSPGCAFQALHELAKLHVLSPPRFTRCRRWDFSPIILLTQDFSEPSLDIFAFRSLCSLKLRYIYGFRVPHESCKRITLSGTAFIINNLLVPEVGLEPTRGKTPQHFECCASTSSATPALVIRVREKAVIINTNVAKKYATIKVLLRE